jgi:hypothetical protein
VLDLPGELSFSPEQVEVLRVHSSGPPIDPANVPAWVLDSAVKPANLPL